MFELTYSRKNIVRTVAVGFVLGSLVLSLGWFVVAIGYLFLSKDPVAIRELLAYFLWFPVVSLFVGVLLGWTVRLGLGLHAYWHYRQTRKTLEI